jgi:hypothetical protein
MLWFMVFWFSYGNKSFWGSHLLYVDLFGSIHWHRYDVYCFVILFLSLKMWGWSLIMECIGNCVWFFWMCGGGFGYVGSVGGRGWLLCLLVFVTMWWFCILYAILRVFGKTCVGQLFGHWFGHGGSQKSVRA